MVADAVHSLSDFVTDIAVIVGLRVAKKPRDSTHNYGHGKIETLAATFIGLVLVIVAFGIFGAGYKKFLRFSVESPYQPRVQSRLLRQFSQSCLKNGSIVIL